MRNAGLDASIASSGVCGVCYRVVSELMRSVGDLELELGCSLFWIDA